MVRGGSSFFDQEGLFVNATGEFILPKQSCDTYTYYTASMSTLGVMQYHFHSSPDLSPLLVTCH